MIRMPNLTDSFTALESGVFFVDDNICLLGNVAGFFTDINDNIYTNKRGRDFFEGLYYRLQSGKNTVIIAESDTIQEYKNLFNYMFETTQYSNSRYSFPQKYAEPITFVDVGLGNDCWIYNKNNIFSRYINYMRDTHMKFDHIIANPPYKFGNQITSTVLDNVDFDEYVNLMPVARYKKNKIYQYIKPNSLVKVVWTGDAATNPQIAELTKSRNEKVTEIDFNIWCYDETWRKFYLLNMNREDTFSDYQKAYPLKYKEIFNIKPDTWFAYTVRSAYDGVHKTENCWDYRWNIQLIDDVPYDNKGHAADKSQMNFMFIKFNTKEEKDNFCKYWYRSGLSNKLLKGLNRDWGECRAAIPKVDWSREWTDEEILKDYGYTDEEIKELLK